MTTPALANETLKFQTGEIYQIALQQLTGKPVASRFTGDQLLYSLIPSEQSPWLRMFVDPYVEGKIQAALIAPGERFEIAKIENFQGNRRVVSIEVRKLGTGTVPPAPVPPTGLTNGLPHHPTPAAPPQLPPQPVNGAGENSAAILSRCYTQAIDIAVAATAYAETKGLRITAGFEDIRAMAATICITEQGRR